jgi:hypothetical protein
MFDFNSARFGRSLTETVAWCAAQSLTAHSADPAAIRHRRVLVEHSEQLLQQAQERVNRSWFRRSVSKTKEWHRALTFLKEVRDSLGPLEHTLRSITLRPSFTLEEFGTDVPWAEAVAEVVAKRSQLVGQTSPEKGTGDEASGRLLLYIPSDNLADGAAQHSSNGFFDVNNVPPWDIWVDFSERTLVSWVPPVLVEAAQMGIDVNPEGCIRWAD